MVHVGAQKLAEWRKRAKLSTQSLGDMLGVSRVAVGRYEDGDLNPSIIVAVRLEVLSSGEVLVEDWGISGADMQVLLDFARRREGGCCALARWAERTGKTVGEVAGLLDAADAKRGPGSKEARGE